MTSSLFAALSGLQAHERWINVIGNNIANASTPGFKSSRAVFSDQFSQTLRFASLPSGTLGGRNPMQVGLGVQLADIGRDMGQGALTTTGRVFDLAINGLGHFMVSDGVNTLYSRVGTFGLDATGRLVDQRTGMRVLGLDNQPISLDTQSLFPPSETANVSFAGNLSADVKGPLPQSMSTTSAFVEGTPAVLTGTVSGPYPIPVGETWSMEIAVGGGAPQRVSITSVTGSVTATEIRDAINALPNSGITAAVTPGGTIELTTDRTGQATSIKIVPGEVGKDLAGLTGLSTTLVTGSEFPATLATGLNSLPSNVDDYQPGDTIEISGVAFDGTPVSSSFVFGTGPGQDGDTIGDLVAFIDALYPQSTASFDNESGNIMLEALETGSTSLSIVIDNGPSSTGSADWAKHAFMVTQEGTGPDEIQSSIEVFDSAGSPHSLTFTFQRQDDGSWNVIPSSAENGASVSGLITGLRFNQDGSLTAVPQATSISVSFAGQGPQEIDLDFGTASGFDGVTQFGGEDTLFADSQDGYGVGELSNMSVNEDGNVLGFYSNGQIESLGAIGVATFVNDNGLREVGENLWAETPNSGTRTVSRGAQARAGEIVGGALEGSNVEIAEEFVRLIEAQRGFQANARVITTTDEVLAELVNLL